MKFQSSFALGAVCMMGATQAFAPVPSSTGRVGALQMSAPVDDKTEVREYFNTEGFSRWNKIYSETDDVNSVQLDIRTGHDQTIQKILNWIQDDGDIKGKSVCDCGCGVGSLAIPLASMGKWHKWYMSSNNHGTHIPETKPFSSALKITNLGQLILVLYALFCFVLFFV